MELASPRNSEHQHNEAAAVEEKAQVIESLQLTPHRLALMQEAVVRGMVKEVEENDGESAGDQVQPVAPSPAQSSTIDESSGHGWAEAGKWEGENELDG